MLTNFTTYAEVRAALGVSDEELADTALALPMYEKALRADFDDISLTLIDTFNTVNALSSPTSAQSRFLAAVHLFATYSVAKHLTSTLPMFSPRSVEDGKARMERFNDPYQKTIAAVESEYGRWQSRLEAAFTALGQSATTRAPRVFMSVAGAASNPITGE